MDQQVVRWNNAPAQVPQTYQRLYQDFLSKSHECNTLALQNEKLVRENTAFRVQLQLQRAPANPGSVDGALTSRIQAVNTRMINHMNLMREQVDRDKKKIKEQQETIEGMRNEIRRIRDFLNTQFKLDT